MKALINLAVILATVISFTTPALAGSGKFININAQPVQNNRSFAGCKIFQTKGNQQATVGYGDGSKNGSGRVMGWTTGILRAGTPVAVCGKKMIVVQCGNPVKGWLQVQQAAPTVVTKWKTKFLPGKTKVVTKWKTKFLPGKTKVVTKWKTKPDTSFEVETNHVRVQFAPATDAARMILAAIKADAKLKEAWIRLGGRIFGGFAYFHGQRIRNVQQANRVINNIRNAAPVVTPQCGGNCGLGGGNGTHTDPAIGGDDWGDVGHQNDPNYNPEDEDSWGSDSHQSDGHSDATSGW